jgi:hypothetical protein
MVVGAENVLDKGWQDHLGSCLGFSDNERGPDRSEVITFHANRVCEVQDEF